MTEFKDLLEHFIDFNIVLLNKKWEGWIFNQHPYYSINLDYHGNEMLDKDIFIRFINNLVDRFGLDWYNKGIVRKYDIDLINSTCRWERCWYNLDIDGFHVNSLRISFDFNRRYKWNIYLRNMKSNEGFSKEMFQLLFNQ